MIGMLKGTLTGLPLCLPGVIFGNLAIILEASFSKFLSGPLVLMAVIDPSLAIVNWTKTLPCIPISWAISGYLKFLAMCFCICS